MIKKAIKQWLGIKPPQEDPRIKRMETDLRAFEIFADKVTAYIQETGNSDLLDALDHLHADRGFGLVVRVRSL